MNFTTNAYKVIFYEKPGCAGNHRQKQLLQRNGIGFETKSILDTKWDSDTLRDFFKDLDNDDIVNKSAPKIKNNQIDILSLSKDQLIDIMCEDPILIKRPLIQIGDNKICGFNIKEINEHIGGYICEDISISTCQKEDNCNQY